MDDSDADDDQDTRKWPELIARLIDRKTVTHEQVAGVLGENVLRACGDAEDVLKQLLNKGVLPSEANWKERICEPSNVDVPIAEK